MLRFGPYAESAQERFAFISERTPPDAVVVFKKPRVMRLMTERLSRAERDCAATVTGECLCVPTGSREDRIAAARRGSRGRRGRLRRIFAKRDFVVYRRTVA